MCGIAGLVDWAGMSVDDSRLLEDMGKRLAHRGPDADGIWVSRCAGLAHRRLTVVDPDGGGQPMIRQCGGHQFVITYNGELYNTAELRGQLEARGYRFEGYSDTEALLYSYIEWGESCLKRLNGIFSFGIWSEADQRLFLARDRLGVKPLFFARRGDLFLFGSELKALLVHPLVEAHLDATGVAEVFMLGPARTPGCGVFSGIDELKPGHCLTHDHNNTSIHRYWSLRSAHHDDDLETSADQVRDLLADTVNRQLVSDVPVCTLLSGGLDSSAITAFAARAFKRDGRPLVTYSIEYADNSEHFRPSHFQPDADEPWALRMASELATEHRRVVIDTADLAAALFDAMRANDLPGMADVDSSLHLFCREIKRDATVALSGEAADEVFGGYPWFLDDDAAAAGRFPWSRRPAARAGLLAPEIAAWIDAERYVAFRYTEALAEVPRLAGEEPDEALRREMFYLNITRFMPTLLDRKDRMSMASGLEVRVPYCDHRLVEYAWNVPPRLKLAGGQSKGLLRQALRGILPADVVKRRKSPYPKTHNPAYTETVRAMLVDVLNDPGSPLLPLVNRERLLELTGPDGEQQWDFTYFGQLMGRPQLFASLVQTDAWMREYGVTVG